MNQSTNQQQEQQQGSFNPILVYEKSKKEMMLASGQCGACERRGFPLFLVRKSIVPKTFKSTIPWTQGMVSLGDREPALSWQDYHYAYRTLREGYVYILCNPIGNNDDSQLDIMAYEVTHSGAFRLREFRDIKGSRPKDIPQSCITDSHQIKAQFITIDNKKYDKAWVAYSAVRWTLSTVNHYRKNQAERMQRFSLVDLTQQKAGGVSPQGRSFLFRDFLAQKRFLLEFECDGHTVRDYFNDESQQPAVQGAAKYRPASSGIPLLDSIRQGVIGQQGRTLQNLLSSTATSLSDLFNQAFYTASHFNSCSSVDARNTLQLTVSRYELDSAYGIAELAALVVEDSLGLAEELAVQRRQRLAPVTEGLAEYNEKSDKVLNDYRRLVRGSSHDYIYKQEKDSAQSELASAMQAKKGRDVFAQYYQDKTSSINHYPLSYFAPEVRYTRQQYREMEQYKASIRAAITENGEHEAYLFLFYEAAKNYQPGHENESILPGSVAEHNLPFIRLNQSLNFYANPQKTLDELSEIDKIHVLDVVGEEFLADMLGVTTPSTERTFDEGYLYCRRLSLRGLTTYQGHPQGLGAYKEVMLSEVQQKTLLTQYRRARSGRKIKLVDSVKVVHFYDLKETKAKLADDKLTDDWDKRKKKLNQASLDNYKSLEKNGYTSLHQYINERSADYYHYLIWLLGEKENYYQVENGAQKAALPTTLNTLLFWKNELFPDSSDMHLNLLASFLLIFDSDSIGTLSLPLHSALWGMLFENKQSIYFYLLGDVAPDISPILAGEKTYWQREIAAMQETQSTKSTTKPAVLQQRQGTDSQINIDVAGIDGEKTFNIVKGIIDAEKKKNISLLKVLIEKWVNTSLEGVNKAASQRVKINDLMAREHFLTVMNLFKGSSTECIRQYQVSMSVKGLHQYLKKMDSLMPFFFNQGMTTDKGSVLDVMQNAQGRWHIPASGNKTIASEKLTVNLLMAFDTADAQQRFEAALANHPNGSLSRSTLKQLQSNIVEVSDTVFDDTDIDRLSAAISRNKRYVEVIDTSVSGIMSGISLYFQINALQSLQKQLETISDPATKALMQLKVMSSYTSIIVTTTELLLRGAKLLSLAKSSSATLFLVNNTNLYAFLDKYIGKVGNVAKVVGIIDSLLSLGQSTKSFYAGNTGSDVFLVTSILSVCVSGAAFFAIPFWGQIALVFVGIGLAIISAIYYSDGSDWDEIDKWLNRSMLGNFDHKDIYPPYYLPTPICMQLSQQDYYLAVNGGNCKIAADFIWYDVVNTDYDLYLDLRLPDFNDEKAVFDGTVTIKKTSPAATVPDYGAGAAMGTLGVPGQKIIPGEMLSTTLRIARGQKQLVMTPSVDLDGFIPRTEQVLDNKKEYYRYDEKIEKKPSQDEKLWSELMQMTTGQALHVDAPPTQKTPATQVGLFLIKQRLGQIKGAHEVSISVNYWPNGRKDKDDNELTPYLLSYHYTK